MSFDTKEAAESLLRMGVADNYVSDGRIGMSYASRLDALERALRSAYERGVRDGRATPSEVADRG